MFQANPRAPPFLTQLLLHQAIEIGDKDLDRLSEELDDFVREELPSRFHSKLRDAEKRMLSSEGLGAVHPKDRLALYRNLLEGNIPTDTEDNEQITLYLSGHFDKKWLEDADKRINPLPSTPSKHEHDAEPTIIDLVDRVFCQGLDEKPAPYERKDNGRVLLKGRFYEFRLADPRTRRPFTLQLFKEIHKTGGELWRNAARALIRVSGYRHGSLPVITDGGYRTAEDDVDGEQEEFAYIIIQEGHVTLAESPHVIEAFCKEKRRRALIQFNLLAEALSKLHGNRLIHRNLNPGAIDVVEKSDSEEGKEKSSLRLMRFEMSDLVENRIRELDVRRKSLDADLDGEQLSFEDIQRLCAARREEDFACLSPERLARLFPQQEVETLESTYSDVFSLAMVVCPWFIDASSQEEELS
uniref:Protein kinase domain-containing protein n=1 Tax=Candidatus Kentrum sp. LPFa TaxID=2126335 RepID=A0A450W6Z7_9GAMM|nr:MAG: hypothetical protein BECKLPF1236A_GA0070988_100775 [Candidatus Kentron sp. LPFa]VFK30599.1 MAG: hypothetical protein BECKLPF1236C_GA0070990_101155 [Candidatus Kentron sp. LPFa]